MTNITMANRFMESRTAILNQTEERLQLSGSYNCGDWMDINNPGPVTLAPGERMVIDDMTNYGGTGIYNEATLRKIGFDIIKEDGTIIKGMGNIAMGAGYADRKRLDSSDQVKAAEMAALSNAWGLQRHVSVDRLIHRRVDNLYNSWTKRGQVVVGFIGIERLAMKDYGYAIKGVQDGSILVAAVYKKPTEDYSYVCEPRELIIKEANNKLSANEIIVKSTGKYILYNVAAYIEDPVDSKCLIELPVKNGKEMGPYWPNNGAVINLNLDLVKNMKPQNTNYSIIITAQTSWGTIITKKILFIIK